MRRWHSPKSSDKIASAIRWRARARSRGSATLALCSLPRSFRHPATTSQSSHVDVLARRHEQVGPRARRQRRARAHARSVLAHGFERRPRAPGALKFFCFALVSFHGCRMSWRRTDGPRGSSVSAPPRAIADRPLPRPSPARRRRAGPFLLQPMPSRRRRACSRSRASTVFGASSLLLLVAFFLLLVSLFLLFLLILVAISRSQRVSTLSPT